MPAPAGRAKCAGLGFYAGNAGGGGGGGGGGVLLALAGVGGCACAFDLPEVRFATI